MVRFIFFSFHTQCLSSAAGAEGDRSLKRLIRRAASDVNAANSACTKLKLKLANTYLILFLSDEGNYMQVLWGANGSESQM
jgi:hypothetical protein